MAKIKIGIAEDHQGFRGIILKLLQEETDMEIIIEAINGKDLLDQLNSKQPDIILMDVRMPIMDGIMATQLIKEKFPNIKIIALTQFNIPSNIIEMNKLGIRSFLGKEYADKLGDVIRIVNNGGVYFSSEVAEILQAHLRRMDPKELQIELSSMQLIILKAICLGWSSSQIGKVIHKSPRTVELYRGELYDLFKVENKEQLIVKATKYSIV